MELRDRRFFGLLGEVVDGNPTEEILQATFAAAGLPWKYISISVAPGIFDEAFRAVRTLGFSGLHITKPYKIEAVGAVDRLTSQAAAIGAVNCVVRNADTLVGDNTDGRGLIRAVEAVTPLRGARVVVLGAGGAARAVAVELAIAGAREVTIVNRSVERARSLVGRLEALGTVTAAYEPWAGRYRPSAETTLLVNATSIGMLDPDEGLDVDLQSLRADAVVADVVIAPGPTRLLRDASAQGLGTVEGSEMLVQQAAVSFELWAGQPPDMAVMRAALAASWS
jgi:shikimate dehydrogenase